MSLFNHEMTNLTSSFTHLSTIILHQLQTINLPLIKQACYIHKDLTLRLLKYLISFADKADIWNLLFITLWQYKNFMNSSFCPHEVSMSAFLCVTVLVNFPHDRVRVVCCTLKVHLINFSVYARFFQCLHLFLFSD